MLSNIIFGDQSVVKHDWQIINDKYGNAFIANESISQKIRIGSKVTPKLECVVKSPRAVTYDIPENIFISNNNKNMNVSIMNYWAKKDSQEEQHMDDDIIYITVINKDYKMISYDTPYSIVQTYKGKNQYNGLAIVIPHVEDDSDSSRHNVFTMTAKDLHSNKFVSVCVDIDSDGHVTTLQYTIEDKNVVRDCKNKLKKLGDKMLSFTISTGRFPTSTFIVPKSKVSDIKKIGEKIPNINIIEIDEDAFSDKKTSAEKASLKKLFTEKILNERIRAITTVGVRIPHSFCKEYKILYLFNYDIEKDTTKCIKSN